MSQTIGTFDEAVHEQQNMGPYYCDDSDTDS